jgi:hypothetical protein
MNTLLLLSAQKLRAMHALRRWIHDSCAPQTQEKFSDATATAASALQTRGQLHSAWLPPPPHTRTHTRTLTCLPVLYLLSGSVPSTRLFAGCCTETEKWFSGTTGTGTGIRWSEWYTGILTWYHRVYVPVRTRATACNGLQFGNSEVGVKNGTGGGGGRQLQ